MRKFVLLFFVIHFIQFNAKGQGENCSGAVTVMLGVYSADGPSTGTGAVGFGINADSRYQGEYLFFCKKVNLF